MSIRLLVLLFVSTPSWAHTLCLQELLPQDSSVASLFSGGAVIESGLASSLEIQIDAVDIAQPKQEIPNIRFIEQDLMMPHSALTKYQRVLLISPWINPKTIFTFRDGPMKLPFTPRTNSVVAPACEALTSNIPSADYILLCERLGILFESIALAHDRLVAGGKILLVTELINGYPISSEDHNSVKNQMIDSQVHREIAIQMLTKGFPDLAFQENDELKSEILSFGRSDNPWNADSLHGWVISKR